MAAREKDEKKTHASGSFGLGSLFKGLEEMVGKLGELAQAGQSAEKSGSFETDKGIQGVYGWSVKVGLGDEGIKVEPFGTVHPGEEGGEESGTAAVREVREPLVDVFEEDQGLLVVAEMPGIGDRDLCLELEDDILELSAERGEKRYHKEILLPRSFSRDQMEVTSNNGVIEIRFSKKADGDKT